MTEVSDGTLLSFVGYDGEQHLVTNTEELDSRLSELPSGADLFRLRLFSHTEDITRPLRQGICLSFRQFDKLGRCPPVFRDLEEDTTTFRLVFCECDKCSGDQSCGIGSILEVNLPYYQLAEAPQGQVKEQSHRSYSLHHLFQILFPEPLAPPQSEILLGNGGIKLGGDMLAEPAWAQFRILRYTSPYGRVNVETFHMGPLPLKPANHTTLSHVLAQLGLICDAWDELLVACKAKLLALSERDLSNVGYSKRNRAIQELSEFAQMWDKFREVQQLHLKAARQLEFPGEDGLGVFLNHAYTDGLPEYDGQQKQLWGTLKRLENIEKSLKEDLADETRQLISKVWSVHEEYDSSDRNTDKKRLIFIPPLIFAASMLGMNFNLLGHEIARISVLIPFGGIILAILLLISFSARFFQPKTQNPDPVKMNRMKESPAITELVCAAENGLYRVVGHLLREGADVNGPSIGYHNPSWTPLQAAAGGGHLNIVELLLQEGASVNAPPTLISGGLTALQAAAKGGHLEVVELLLQHGASVNALEHPTTGGLTALQAAAQGGHLEVVKRLLKENANVNEKSDYQKHHAALYLAAKGGHREVVEYLLEGGADVHLLCNGRTALHAAAKGGHIETIEYLLKQKADINAPGHLREGWTALHAAAKRGNLKTIEYLLKEKADINIICQGLTALQMAAGRGHLEVVERLLQGGANVNANTSPNGFPALHTAASAGHLEVVKRLLLEEANVNEPKGYSHGQKALYGAATGGHLPVVELLLKEKVDVNAPGCLPDGQTALHGASSKGHLEIVELLLRKKADVNIPYGQCGQTALHSAADGGHLKIVESLLREKANVNAYDSQYGWTALHSAVQGGRLEIVERLLQEKADVKENGSQGQTLLDLAADRGYLKIVERLLQEKAVVDVYRSQHGYSQAALYSAARKGYLKIVERLLQEKADVSGQYGQLALQAAVQGGHLKIVERLLQEKVDVSGEHGQLALQAAVQCGYLEIVELLLREKAIVSPSGMFCKVWYLVRKPLRLGQRKSGAQ